MRLVKKILHYGIAIILLAACTESSFDDMTDLGSQDSGLKDAETQGDPIGYCNDEPVIFDLIAGRTMNAGMVTLTNDDVNLYITYETTDGSLIREVHVYVGDEEGIPVNKKNIPVPGQFPYKVENIHLATYTVVIPLSEITVECPLIITHAALSNGETAWGWENEEEMFTFENFFDIKRWGYLGDYCIEECTDYKYLTMKFWYTEEDGEKRWGVIQAVHQFYFQDNWCDKMGVIIPTEDTTLNVTHGTLLIGEITLDVGEELIHGIINLDDPTSVIDSTFVFYGSFSDLVTYGSCPDYLNFPHVFMNPDAEEFDIHINNGLKRITPY